MTGYNFNERAKKVHGNLYDYSNVNYKNARTKVCIICPKHGEFWQLPSNHVSGKGCLKCSYIERIEIKRKNKIKDRFANIIQPEEYKLIPLTQGKFAKVDNEDFDKVKDIVWSFSHGYAYNHSIGRMHRFIMDPPNDMVVDHVNGDGLDNRRRNIRICTQQQNSFNSRKRGCYFNNTRQRWVSEIMINGKKKHIGVFKTEAEARNAYNNKSKELFGEYHWSNDRRLTKEEVIDLLFGKDGNND